MKAYKKILLLRKLPSIVLQKVSELKHPSNIRRNYSRFLESGNTAITGDLPYNSDVVSQQFIEAGYPPDDYYVDIKGFNEYCLRHEKAYQDYKEGLKELFIEKALEHYVSLSFCPLTPDGKVIDIANAGSPFPEIVHADYGCNVWSNDLAFPKGIHQRKWHTKIGGDACELPVNDNFFDLAVLHCAFEMFEGEADINLIRKAERMLKPGGRLVVIPLYMNETYHILRDPRTYRNPLPEIDEGAELVYRENFYGAAFARFYSVGALMKRLVNSAENLDFKIYRVRNLPELNAFCYMNWVGVFEKKPENKMVDRIYNNDNLLAIIVRSQYYKDGIEFFTPDDFAQQLAYMSHPAGYIIAPHVHNKVHREVFTTQEVLFIKKGRVKVNFYDGEQSNIDSRILKTGDVIFLASGGHGFEMIEPTEMIEAKQGPYAGATDKERFKP